MEEIWRALDERTDYSPQNAEFTPLHFLVARLDFPKIPLYNGFIELQKSEPPSLFGEERRKLGKLFIFGGL